MGIYYMVACDELEERIDPAVINDFGNKAGAIVHQAHPLGSVVIFALLHRWAGKAARVVDDIGNDPGYWKYMDITKDILNEYNNHYETNLQFTGNP